MNNKLIDLCTYCDVKRTVEDKGYVYFSKGIYNLNIIGVRSKESIIQHNRFDDVIIITYTDSLKKECRLVIAATTDPGIDSLKAPVNTKGCAILVPGQYRGLFTKGKHKGKYPALVQAKPCKVYRDDNKDEYLDCDNDTIDEGMFGINLHKAGQDSTYVNNWSAGCQVVKKSIDFEKVMKLVDKALEHYSNSFTYTLINEQDLKF